MKLCLHTPKPGQHIGGEHGDSRTCCDAGQGLLGTGLTVSKLVATDYDCDQACNLCNCAGEEGLHSRESGGERRLCVCEGGQEEKQGYDAKVWAQAAPEDSPQPT